MMCATCGAPEATGVVSISENIHEMQCDRCMEAWCRSVNRALFEHAVVEGRWGNALSEFRNWQATRRSGC